MLNVLTDLTSERHSSCHDLLTHDVPKQFNFLFSLIHKSAVLFQAQAVYSEHVSSKKENMAQ